MDQDQVEKLRSRIDDVPHNADGRRRYTAPLKRDLIAYARARQAAGWIQRRIAEALGVSKATVCCWIGVSPRAATRAPRTWQREDLQPSDPPALFSPR